MRIYTDKEIFSRFYDKISGDKRDNTVAVFGSTCLLLSAILKQIAKQRTWRDPKQRQRLEDYAKILRSEYSYIADVRIFNHILSSVSYVPGVIEFVQNFEVPTTRAQLSGFVDNVQHVNLFLLQLFEDLAFVGDHKFFKVLTRNSMKFWYLSSKFWFLYIVVDLVKRNIIEREKSVRDFSVKSFVKENGQSLLNLVLAYHWGWNWKFLSDSQLALLNLSMYSQTFRKNWSL